MRTTYIARGYCKECDILFPSARRGGTNHCPKCNNKAKVKCVDKTTPLYNDHKFERCGVDALHVENERWSDAMGINPDQRAEFGQKFPWMEFNKEGQCRVGSRHEKLKIMKARGFIER